MLNVDKNEAEKTGVKAYLSNRMKRSLEFWCCEGVSELRKIIDLCVESRSLTVTLEIVFNTRFLTDQVAVKTISTLSSIFSNNRKSAGCLLFGYKLLAGNEGGEGFLIFDVGDSFFDGLGYY